VEEVYQDSPYIKELSVIGLPDGIGEKVACIVVPMKSNDIALSRAEVRQKIEEHFREVSATLPYYNSQAASVTDEELPRTATRKSNGERCGTDAEDSGRRASSPGTRGRRNYE